MINKTHLFVGKAFCAGVLGTLLGAFGLAVGTGIGAIAGTAVLATTEGAKITGLISDQSEKKGQHLALETVGGLGFLGMVTCGAFGAIAGLSAKPTND